MHSKLWFAFVIATLLSGCMSTPIKIADYSQQQTFDAPRAGERISRNTGEVMLRMGSRVVGPAIQLSDQVRFNKAEGEASVMTCAVTAAAGLYPKRGEYTANPKGAECFGPVAMQLTLSDGRTNFNCPGQLLMWDICVDAGNNYFAVFALTKALLKQDFERIRRTERVVGEGMVRELLYGGRVEDRVLLTYREFTESSDKPSFVQELQYDLGESEVLQFRDLRLRVIEASGQGVTFELL
jgi:hypothetical protein